MSAQLTLDLGFAQAVVAVRLCVTCESVLSAADLRHGRRRCVSCRTGLERERAAEADFLAGAPLWPRRCGCDRPMVLSSSAPRCFRCGRRGP